MKANRKTCLLPPPAAPVPTSLVVGLVAFRDVVFPYREGTARSSPKSLNLDENVGDKLAGLLARPLSRAPRKGHGLANEDVFSVQQVAVDLGNGPVSGVSLQLEMFPKASGECVVHGFFVNGLVKASHSRCCRRRSCEAWSHAETTRSEKDFPSCCRSPRCPGHAQHHQH